VLPTTRWAFRFCQIAHRRLGDRVQFALIHMAHGGTSPTNMFAILATYMRQQFEVDAGRIDWYDVHPLSVYRLERTQILSVALQHANGIYSKPEWGRGPAISEDWAAFISLMRQSCVVRQLATLRKPFRTSMQAKKSVLLARHRAKLLNKCWPFGSQLESGDQALMRGPGRAR
jgi:hypothetical protein